MSIIPNHASFVALRKESVDRNFQVCTVARGLLQVALRKESVDRNCYCSFGLLGADTVALRKESVDRNVKIMSAFNGLKSRSPQGERG